MSITPTWEHYGTHDDSEFPELWDGCVGAWAPCLGPSGTVLYDLSGLGQHAYPYNLAAQSIWTRYGGITSAHSDPDGYWLTTLSRALDYPFSLVLSFATDEITTDHSAVFLSAASGAQCFGLSARGAQDDKVWAQSVDSAGASWAASSNTYLAGYPYTACGVWRGDSNREASLNGSSFVVNTTTRSVTMSTITLLALGALIRPGESNYNYYSNCGILDARLYSRAIDINEAVLLSTPGIAYTPRRARRFYSFADIVNRRRRLLLAA